MTNEADFRHWSLSRRVFLGGATTVLAAPAAGFAVPALGAIRAPVITFAMDRPHLDWSGEGAPYRPPLGVRAGQPLAEASEDELARRFPFF